MRQGTYIAIVLAIVLGGYAALIGIGASPLYCRYSKSFTDAAPCYKSRPIGQRAETLLVGDSSLLYGVRPDLVAAAGGGSSFNLGMVGPSFSYDPASLIDAYLAHNMRPKRIILYFAPWDVITRDRLVDPQWVPLAVLLLQRGDVGELLHLVALRPSIAVEAPSAILNNLGPDTAANTARRAAMAAQGGFLDYAALGLPVLDHCVTGSRPPPPYSFAADNRAAIQALKARYAARGVPLFVLIAPWAVCDQREAAVRAAYRGLADAPAQAFADRLFVSDTPKANHVHASREGVTVFSQRVADFIKAVAVR